MENQSFPNKSIGENLFREWCNDKNSNELRVVLRKIIDGDESSIADLIELAESGSSLSMMYLGNIYIKGKYGIKMDQEKGLCWLRRSAENGSIEAAYGLAWSYLQFGRLSESFSEYKSLADRNYPPALYVIGNGYFRGKFGIKDIDLALSYLKKASDIGHFPSKNLIAHIYVTGRAGIFKVLPGIFKRVAIAYPFLKEYIKYPESDMFRV